MHITRFVESDLVVNARQVIESALRDIKMPFGTWTLMPHEGAAPWKEEEANALVRLIDQHGKWLASVYGEVWGESDDRSILVLYSEVREDMRGKGVYRALLHSLSLHMDVYSDEHHNNSAENSYIALGATRQRDRMRLARREPELGH